MARHTQGRKAHQEAAQRAETLPDVQGDQLTKAEQGTHHAPPLLTIKGNHNGSGSERDVVQGKLSAVISDIWNEAEKIAKAIPLREEAG